MTKLRAERTAADLTLRTATVHALDARDLARDIQRGIPIPAKRNGALSRYLERLQRMEIGDSFFVPDRGRLTSAVKTSKQLGYTVTTRKIGRGIRLWRTS